MPRSIYDLNPSFTYPTPGTLAPIPSTWLILISKYMSPPPQKKPFHILGLINWALILTLLEYITKNLGINIYRTQMWEFAYNFMTMLFMKKFVHNFSM